MILLHGIIAFVRPILFRRESMKLFQFVLFNVPQSKQELEINSSVSVLMNVNAIFLIPGSIDNAMDECVVISLYILRTLVDIAIDCVFRLYVNKLITYDEYTQKYAEIFRLSENFKLLKKECLLSKYSPSCLRKQETEE